MSLARSAGVSKPNLAYSPWASFVTSTNRRNPCTSGWVTTHSINHLDSPSVVCDADAEDQCPLCQENVRATAPAGGCPNATGAGVRCIPTVPYPVRWP